MSGLCVKAPPEKRVPFYDYQCPANGRIIEVRHSMRETVSSWASLCELADLDPGDTPHDSPVERLVSAPGVMMKPGVGAAGACCSGPCDPDGCGPGR